MEYKTEHVNGNYTSQNNKRELAKIEIEIGETDNSSRLHLAVGNAYKILEERIKSQSLAPERVTMEYLRAICTESGKKLIKITAYENNP